MAEKKSCTCMKDVEDKIIEHAKSNERNPTGYKIINSDWEHKSIYPGVRLYSNYLIKSTFTKKDGTESKPRNEHVSIYYSYCPFCGKEYPATK